MIEGFSITFSGVLQFGAGGIVAASVFMLYRGLLYPKVAVDRIQKEADARVEREKEIGNIWKEAHDTRANEVIQLTAGLRDAIDGLRTVESLIVAIRNYGKERPDVVASLEAKREEDF